MFSFPLKNFLKNIIIISVEFLAFGGLNSTNNLQSSVQLVDITTGDSCFHSELPVALKEAHVFEFKDSIILCSTFTKTTRNELQCFQWKNGKWKTFAVPDHKPMKFISAVKIPDVGIWFVGHKGNKNSLLLKENGDWSTGPKWTNLRTRACMVLVSDTEVAHIGGQKAKGADPVGDTMDVYDFSDPDDPVESLDVASMGWHRKHLSCALISKAPRKPAVAISKLI